jgi:hypothetical protein
MKGLYNKYILQKTDGRPLDENSEYFILRLDKGGDREHVIASRKAILTYAGAIRNYLPELASDIYKRWGVYRTLMTVTEVYDSEIKVYMNSVQDFLVTIPKNIIPDYMLKIIKPNVMLTANVNIGCESPSDLFFYDFEFVDARKI